MLSVTPTLALTGSHCHFLAYSLIGSQGPCSALSAAVTMTHFVPLW